jgi:hypothetical protein
MPFISRNICLTSERWSGFSRGPLVLLERVKLPDRDDIALSGVLFCEKRAPILTKAARNIGR